MNLFIDTSQKDFVAFLYDQNNKIIYQQNEPTKYKVEATTNFFDAIAKHIRQIKNIYINLGPGSFTGSRAALLYIRTLAQLNPINIYTTNSFKLLTTINKLVPPIYLLAHKSKSYCFDGNQIQLVDKNKNEAEINYDELINNFALYESAFTLTPIDELQPLYGANPQIGSL